MSLLFASSVVRVLLPLPLCRRVSPPARLSHLHLLPSNAGLTPLKDSNEVSGSKGEANLVWRCQNCKVPCHIPHASHLPSYSCTQRQHTANIQASPVAYQLSDPPKRQKLLTVDCRGLELVGFSPEGVWRAKGADSNTAFADVDLSEGEWFDYDEKAGDEVSIKNLKWEVIRA